MNSTNFTIEELLEEIETRSKSLNYLTETDAGVTPFQTPQIIRGGTLSAASFLNACSFPPLTPISELSFDAFFDPIINRDETGRWEILKNFLEENLSQTKVFKIFTNNNSTAYDIYAVGLYSDGFSCLGVKTNGVAT